MKALKSPPVVDWFWSVYYLINIQGHMTKEVNITIK